MRYFHGCAVVFFSALLCACATSPAPNQNPQNLNSAPDLSAFQHVELTANTSHERLDASARFIASGAYLDVLFPAPSPQRLYAQPQECRNDGDAFCARRFILSGELDAFSSQLQCYIEIRNDANSAYFDQALQGLCHDQYRRSYSIMVSK